MVMAYGIVCCVLWAGRKFILGNNKELKELAVNRAFQLFRKIFDYAAASELKEDREKEGLQQMKKLNTYAWTLCCCILDRTCS